VKVNPKDDLSNHLIAYFTLGKKLIIPTPRKVEMSREALATLGSHPKSSQIGVVINKLTRGISVIPHLSKRASQLRFHDYMLYEWSIYHLHIDAGSDNLRFAAGEKDDLMFIYIDKDTVYVLDVTKHTPTIFNEKKWLELIKQNWPILLDRWIVEDAIDISREPTDSQRQFYREKLRVNAGTIKIDGTVYLNPGLGYTSSGHSAEAADRTVGVMGWLKRLEIEKDGLKHKFVLNYNVPFEDIRMRMRLTDQGIELYDHASGILIQRYP
jgi:hypothetical protein